MTPTWEKSESLKGKRKKLMCWATCAGTSCLTYVCVCVCVLSDAILNMVNNIAANVMGGKSDLEGRAEAGGNSNVCVRSLLSS